MCGQPLLAAPLPTLVLYPRTVGDPDDIRALVDLRKKLRADGQFEVLTYDPEAAAVVRAADEANHPDWLTGPMTADADRLALSRSLGAAFFVVVSRADGRGKSDVRLEETAPGARFWSVYGKKTDDAARAVEQQAQDALAHPASVAPSTPPVASVPLPAHPAPPPVVTPLPKPAPILPPVVPVVAAPAPTVPRPVPLPPVVTMPPVEVKPTPPGVTVTPAPPKPAPVVAAPPVVLAAPNPAPPPAKTAPPAVIVVPVPKTEAPPVPTLVAPSSLPIPAPTTVPKASLPTAPAVVLSPPSAVAPVVTAPVSVRAATPPVDDLSAIQGTLDQGDAELARGNFIGAIAFYRDAVNGAPLSTTPRLKLAEAYLEADMRDKALDEAERALGVAPDSKPIQQFLMRLDAQTGSADGAVARYSALVAQNSQDPEAHLELGDALWNNNQVAQAEDEYKTAQSDAAPGSPSLQAAAAHLARLYAAQSRYTDCLLSLKDAGASGYALALEMVQSRADTLMSTLDVSRDAFTAGKSTHADFYKVAGDVRTQAQDLADFVVRVTPPPAFKISHLYRVQATHLLAQQAAVLVTYIETTDPVQADKADQLGKEAQTAMLTAHAAETKLGLWDGKQSEAKN